MDAFAAAGQVQGHNNAAARRSMPASSSASIQQLGSGSASSTPSTSTRLLPAPIAPTPRRAAVEQTRTIYRIKQHQPPTALLPHVGDVSREFYRAQIRWWENVQYWLEYLLRAVNGSLSKCSTDLRTCSEITPVGRKRKPRGDHMDNEEWMPWDAQELNRNSCNLDTIFYGPPSLVDTSIPCLEEMSDISSFEESHRAYMQKHMGHLYYMRDLIERLKLQAESKIKGLIDELKKLEEFPDFRRPKFSHNCAVIFPSETAPGRTLQSGVVQHIHYDDEQDLNEDTAAMASEFSTLPDHNYESFNDMGLAPRLLQGIKDYGFQYPSAIQQRGIVPICLGKNVILYGQSGIGKRSSFSCGILQRINYGLLECQALVLVHAPQHAQHMKKIISEMGWYLGVKVHSCVGGKLASVQEDQRILTSGVHVVVGTPGPILDMLHKSLLRPNNIKIFVLGKADVLSRHTDLIYEILRHLPSAVQIGVFSDTLTVNAIEITREIMDKPLFVAVKIEHSLVGIQQFYVDVGKEQWKLSALLEMYHYFGITKVKSIIYVNTPDKVRLLSSQLELIGHHKVLTTRNDSSVDLRGIAYVINYDIPADPSEYLRCVGHTKQFGKRHVAISLVTVDQKNIVKDMEKIHNVVIEELPDSL